MELNRDEYRALLAFINDIRPHVPLDGYLLETIKRKTVSILYKEVENINALTKLGYKQVYRGNYGATFIHQLFIAKYKYDTNPKELKKLEITFE
jgi:hypothetical protein